MMSKTTKRKTEENNWSQDEYLIKITHYINPHMFWFKYESSFFNNEKFTELYTKIETYFIEQEKTTRRTAHKPQLGEIVGIFYFPWNRWIRAKVDYIFQLTASVASTYILWAIDYGVPLQIEDRFIRKLPQELAEAEIDIIHFGGIADIVPAERIYNFNTSCNEVVNSDKWSPYSFKAINDLINDAAFIRFIPRAQCKKTGQLFGDLEIITHTNQIIKPEIGLLDSNHAKKVSTDEFFKILHKIRTNKLLRWQTYNGTANVYAQDTTTLINLKRTMMSNHKPEEIVDDEFLENIHKKFDDWDERNKKAHGKIATLKSNFKILKEKVEKSNVNNEIRYDDNNVDETDDSVTQKLKNDDVAESMIKTDINEYKEEFDTFNEVSSKRLEKMEIYKMHVPPPRSLQSFIIKEQRNDVCIEKTETNNISSSQQENKIYKEHVPSPPSLKSLNIKEQRNNDVLTDETEPKNISSSEPEDKEDCKTSECSISKSSETSESNISKSSNMDKNKTLVIANRMEILRERRKRLQMYDEQFQNQQAGAAKNEINEKLKSPETEIAVPEKIIAVNEKKSKNTLPAGIDLSKLTKKAQNKLNDDKTNRNDKYGKSKSKNENFNVNIKGHEYFSNDIKRNESNNKMNDRNKVYAKQSNDQSGKHLQDYGEVCVIDNNLKKHLVLVHGRQTRPIEKLENANFCEDVHRELENMRLNRMYRIQSYTWSHLMRGNSNSAVIINSARTGKTMSYLPVICSLIKMEKDKNVMKESEGAVAIIIVPSSVEVEKISNICYRLFQNSSNKLSIVESYGIRKAKNTSIQLLNGCDILITTPPSLIRLFADKVKHFDMKKLRHLVIDNMDLIHESVQHDLNLILKKFLTFSQKNESHLQLIITARLWQNYIYKYTQINDNTELCIGAYIEAAVYGKSKINMTLINKKSKNQIILDFLNEHPYTDERLVIVCNSDEDCKEVERVLKDNSHSVTSVCSKSSASEIQNAYEWHLLPKQISGILVCTDSVLYECKIQNAQNLIHYSLPNSWTRFTFRFTVLFEYYEDFTIKKSMTKPPAVSLILLDETNNSQLPKLIEFLKCHGYGSNISEEILNLSNQIKIQKEEKRIESNREFCMQLLSFGQCRTDNDCKYRHTLTKYDAPENHVPVDGIVVVQVLSVTSPSHYCVRILEHHSKNGTITKNSYSNNYAKFFLEFSQYFNNSDNHQTHWPININDLCVVNYRDTYYRAKILNVKTKSTYTNTFDVRVKFVDNGRIMSFKSSCLLVLPEKFQNYPFQAVNIRISGIVPYDFEEEWDSTATHAVQEWILNKKNILRGNILFSLMDTIWVDKIVIQEELKDISCVVYAMNIKKELLEKQYAISLEEVTDVIRDMAYKCGILQSIESTKDDIENENPVNNLKINSKLKTEMVEEYDCNKSENSISKNNSINLNLNKSTKSSTSEANSNVCSSSGNLEKSNLERARTKKRRSKLNEQSQIVKSDENKIKTETKSHRIRKKITERWATLRENEFSRIDVSAFYNPNLFYVRDIEDNEKYEKLNALIDRHMESEDACKITKPKIWLNCLAKLNNTYNRAKITKFLCTPDNIEVSLFFCDSGLRSVEPLNEIYHSTKEIVRILPFQAIRCKLIGVQPSNGSWTSEICDLIYDSIIDTCEYLYVKPIKTTKQNSECEIPCWQYEVIMLDCTGDEDININDEIVEKEMALYDPDTEHILHKTFNNNCESKTKQNENDENEEENWDHINIDRKFQLKLNNSDCNDKTDNEKIFDFDIQFTEENTLELLNQFPTSILPPTIIENLKNQIKNCKNQNTLIEPVKKQTAEIFEIEKTEKINEPDNKMQSYVNDGMPGLKNLFNKTLNVVWQQSETLICLSIATSEIDDYRLHVNSESLFFEAYRNDQKSAIHINFLGTVCSELTSHEIKGLNVIIRLVKSTKGIFWPRLTWDSDKHNWLKYNYETIKIDEEFVIKDQRNAYDFNSNNIRIVDSSSSVSEDDNNENCIDVDRENDVFDPLADDF